MISDCLHCDPPGGFVFLFFQLHIVGLAILDLKGKVLLLKESSELEAAIPAWTLVTPFQQISKYKEEKVSC